MSEHVLSLAANPGVAYPERAMPRETWYERSYRALGGHLGRALVPTRRSLAQFPALVDDAAAATAALSDAALGARAAEVGRRLRAERLGRDAAAAAFALVREAAQRTLGLRHYDVQLMGGWVLLSGKLAEMETGEGKTLTATLAAATAALAGLPVHVITVNDYLAERDAETMAPLYAMLGLTTGCVLQGMQPDARRAAYGSDITYCTNKEVAFDYLKDRITLGGLRSRLRARVANLGKGADSRQLLLRGLFYAIVDEADSVMVDEARTPLIISGPSGSDGREMIYRQAVEVAAALTAGRDFTIVERERDIELTPAGRERTAELAPDDGIWTGPRRREELVKQGLSALNLFRRDEHYLVRDDKVQIIDEYTGRVFGDRSWEQGLHQMIEAKEGVTITGQKDPLARGTYQRFFRRYLRLSGMTGTARELAAELWSVYGLEVVRLPTHRPVRRRFTGREVTATVAQKWQRVAERVREQTAAGRPVLVGTRSVAASEALAEVLTGLGIAHCVLNARQDETEAAIVAEAGRAAQVTVATNMAGRGTDIKLDPEIEPLGGLHVIATELHDSRRIDRQLFGRCARQGDPGSYELILSLEDELVRTFGAQAVRWLLARLGAFPGGPAAAWHYLRGTQRRAERLHSRIRRDLLNSDERLEDSLSFSGHRE
jgi:preprotein translocase subunit SecA